MEIGTKRLVASTSPYSVFGENNKIPKFKVLECVEKRLGRGEFTGKESQGYLFKDSKGTLYGYNYPHVYEGYGAPSFTKYFPDEEFIKLSEVDKWAFIAEYIWFDVSTLTLPEELEITKGLDFVSFCPKHLRYFYTDDCVWCEHNLPNEVGVLETIRVKTTNWYNRELELD